MRAAPEKTKIAVALSGGVDSSTAAALLKEEGCQIIGLTMRLFDHSLQQGRNCGQGEAIDQAAEAADKLGIPHQVIDCRREFKSQVVDYFVEAYRRGLTPNPCVACNQQIKFGLLLQKAGELGCRYLATGHYARIRTIQGRPALARGKDGKKDQSYFLWALDREQLERVVFPLGVLTKERVRSLAGQYGLSAAQRPESQEICFIPNGRYSEFISRYLEPVAGNIIDSNGKVLGKHRGIVNYTVGQREGLGIALGRPQYVLSIDPVKNTVTVGDNHELMSGSLRVGRVNWILPRPAKAVKARVKIRHQHAGARATVRPLGAEAAEVTFDQPQRAVTPGQSAVFYRGDLVLGGGVIE